MMPSRSGTPIKWKVSGALSHSNRNWISSGRATTGCGEPFSHSAVGISCVGCAALHLIRKANRDRAVSTGRDPTCRRKLLNDLGQSVSGGFVPTHTPINSA